MSEISRRKFIQLTMLSGATAAVAGCDVPDRMKPQSQYNDRIYRAEVTGQYGGYADRGLPYVNQPDGYQDGVPQYFATVCGMCPAGCGLRVRTLNGRAVQVTGNPDHPVSRGGVCARGVASLQQLYSPDRLRFPSIPDETGVTWERVLSLTANALQHGPGKKVILTDAMTVNNQPTLSGALAAFAKNMGASLVSYSLLDDSNWRAAARAVYGRDQIPYYALDEADCILGFGADFLEAWPSPVLYGRLFGEFRQGPRRKQGEHGKFIYIGPRMNLTAANADLWLPCAPGTEGLVAEAIYAYIAAGLEEPVSAVSVRASGLSAEQITAAANAFRASKTRGVAIGGSSVLSQANGAQAMIAVERLNSFARSQCVGFGSSALPVPTQTVSLSQMQALIADMNAGRVGALVLVGQSNPVFTLPATLGFAEALAKVPFVAALSPFEDETTAFAHVLLPTRTFLEDWGDAVPSVTPTGTKVASLRQPVIDPIFVTDSPGLAPEQYVQDTVPWMDTLPTLNVLREVAQRAGHPLPYADARDAVRRTWASLGQADLSADLPNNDRPFVDALSRGGVWSKGAAVSASLMPGVTASASISGGSSPTGASGSFALHLYPHIYWTDGRHANLGWMQENPDPMTSAIWNSWVEINMEVAHGLGIRTGDIVRLSTAHGSIEVAAVPFPGIHPGAVAMPLGQGHTAYGSRATGRGQNPLAILEPTQDALTGAFAYGATHVTLTKVRSAKPGYNGHETLVLTQDRPGGTEPEAVKDLIHTTAKEWKTAPPVTGPAQAEGSIFNRSTGEKAGNPPMDNPGK